ncbi:ArnT family glycosyltransferase [Solihabitans fulvus]|uniref:ArnT family glycosyltransferase n=1 Tax=Solihabitans fulvus TaxID=1892852 RepID=UPI001661FAB0|nr:glycosyltransferase family 39 protein [Solihabitans fulvus]
MAGTTVWRGAMGETVMALRRDRMFLVVLLGVLVVAALLRLWDLSVRPGFDWDEPVYASIGANLADHGLLQAKIEAGMPAEPYLYHPPFYFLLLAAWFRLWGSGIPQARALAAVGAIALVLLVALFLRRAAGTLPALLAASVLALDGWMVFTNRVSSIENTMLPLGVATLWLYWTADRRGRTGWFVAAGIALAGVAVYKHVGVYFLGAALLHWLLVRRHHRQHLAMVGAAALTAAAYLAGVSLWFGGAYWRESTVQFDRSVNLQQSRGAINSVSDAVGPLLDQYRVFWLTLLLAGIATALVLTRAVQMVRRRSLAPIRGRELLFAWAAAAMLFFAALQLRLPQYFVMFVVPTYCYLAAEVGAALDRRASTPRPVPRRAVAVGLALLAAWSLTVFWLRIADRDDNAMGQAAQWVDQHVPVGAEIITEESVGAAIRQPYCKMYRAGQCTGAEYLITYESHTQHLPDDASLGRIIAAADRIAEFSGFKEHITVYRIAR